jgi:hypothetical protein
MAQLDPDAVEAFVRGSADDLRARRGVFLHNRRHPLALGEQIVNV